MSGHIQHRMHWTKGLAAVAAIAALCLPALAGNFQSIQIETIACGMTTGGHHPQFLKIDHSPIVRVSPNTKEALIIGDAGFETLPNLPTFPQCLTTSSKIPVQNRLIRVWVEYQVLPAFQTVLSSGTIGPIEGPDPMSFAFQIDPKLIASGQLQYRILAQRLNGTVEVSTAPAEINGVAQWYTVGVLANAVESIGAQGGRVLILDGNPAVGQSSLDIPKGIFSAPTAVTLDELPTNDANVPPGLNNQAYRVYHIDSQTPIRNGSMLASFAYPDFTYPIGQDGIVDGTTTPETKVGIAWWDGFIWRPLGGLVNAQANLVTARIGEVGYYAVGNYPAPSPEDRRPMQKIITPNGDGKNDYAEFLFAGVVDSVRIEIFDMTGHRIRTLYSDVDTQGWDGRDDTGNKVESGVYIYQFKYEGKQVSGLIAVAK